MACTHVAFLRGINVGGKNKLAMKDLCGLFTEAGCASVASYIQSGNVVFEAPAERCSKLPAEIARNIENRWGLRTPVVMRNAAEIRDIASHNPFLTRGEPEETLHVMFLADEPNASNVRTLDPTRSAPDEFIVQGREVYLCLPNGAGRSKLTNAYFDTKLKTVSTARNWRTVLRINELLNG